MLLTALILFLLGALGGVAMAILSFRGQSIPWLLAAGHGLLGAAGLVTLIIALIAGGAPGIIKLVLGILVVAALGGFYLLSFHVRKEEHPRVVIVIHAMVAATGVVFLLWTLVQQQA